MAVGTALAVASIASTAISAASSFKQAGEATKLAREQQAEIDRARNEAIRLVEKNEVSALGIAKEGYLNQFQGANVTGAQAIEALRESDRGTGRLGGVYSQKQQIDADIAARMGADIYDLNLLKARSLDQDADALAGIALDEVRGGQLALEGYEKRAAAAKQQGFEQVQRGLGGTLDLLPDNIDGIINTKLDDAYSKRKINKATKGVNLYEDIDGGSDYMNPFDINYSTTGTA